MSTRSSGLNSTALALIPLAIAVNVAVGALVKGTPLYLDSIGTVLVGALLGPWLGLLTGVLSNFISTFVSGDPVPAYFFYVAGIIGLLSGFAARAGVFQRPAPRWLSAIIIGVFFFALALFITSFTRLLPDGTLPSAANVISELPLVFVIATVVGAALGYFVLKNAGYAGLAGLLTGVVAAIASAPMAAYYFGGVTGAGTDVLVGFFRSTGGSILTSVLAQGSVSDPFDKMTSFMLVWLIIQSLPHRLLSRFPLSRAVAEANGTSVLDEPRRAS